MHRHLRPDVLRLVCAELPSAEATWLRSLPPEDLTTHLNAYGALRRLRIHLPRELEDEFLRCVLDHLSCQDPTCRDGVLTSAWFQYAATARHRPETIRAASRRCATPTRPS